MPDLSTIKAHVAARLGVTVAAIEGVRGPQKTVDARHIAMWVCRQTNGATYAALAENFGVANSTVSGALRRFKTDPDLLRLAKRLAAEVDALPKPKTPDWHAGFAAGRRAERDALGDFWG